MKIIILNSSNVQLGSNNSRYTYNFPQGNIVFKKNKIALSNLSIYYSWFNITSANNNNTYSYKWINGVTYNIVMPDGFYDVAALNAYFQSVMITNKHYLIDLNGSYVYYLQWLTNPSYYAIQLNTFVLPSVLPASWSLPSGATWSLSALAPQLIIPATNFPLIVGLSAGSYPSTSQASNQSYTSTFTPQISPTSSILMLCDVINNNLGNSSVLYSFSANVGFGSQININPPTLVWNSILDGAYSSLRVSFVDQNYKPVVIQDNNLVISLAIKEENE